MNAQSDENASCYDTMDPVEVWLKLKPALCRYKYPLAAVTALFMLLGYCLAGLQAPQWQAASVIRVGRVSRSEFIEPLESVILRSRTPEFQRSVLEKCGVLPDSPEAALYKRTLNLQQTAVGMIGLTVRGLSRDSALKLSSATMEEIRGGHALIVSRLLSAPKLRLEAIEKLGRAIAPARAAVEKGSPEAGSLAAVAAAYLAYETGQLRTALRGEVEFLEQNTTVLVAAECGGEPVAPRKKLWTIYSGLSGLFLSAAVCFLLPRENLKPGGI